MKKLFFYILNILLLLSLTFSILVYTSFNKNSFFYDNSGTQFLIIPILITPILLVIGIGLYFLSKKYNINNKNKYLAFISILLLNLPLFIDGSLSVITIVIGCAFNVILIMLTFYSFFITLHENKLFH